ncbi:MAG: hypothetical protein QM640_05190 [Niabella sp.]
MKPALSFIIFLFLSLQADSQAFANPFSKNTGSFNYDKGINNMFLYDAPSITNKLGKNVWELHEYEAKNELPKIECYNKDQTQILRLYFHYGGTKNESAGFQILKMPKGYAGNKKNIRTTQLKFVSALGIYPEISKKDFIKKIGSRYDRKFKNGKEIITYYTNNQDATVFKEYNGVGYRVTGIFQNNRLIDYSFGFEYP